MADFYRMRPLHLSLLSTVLASCGLFNENSKVSPLSSSDENDGFGLAIQAGQILNTPDDLGNVLPDFSYVGYKDGILPIPDIAAVVIVTPQEGDDGARIQAAVDQVSARPLDANGFRGAVLLKKGKYEVASDIKIRASGVVLRGEGSGDDGTVIVATGKQKRDLISVKGNAEFKRISGTEAEILDTYVPSGHRSFTVNNSKPFAVGDKIVVDWAAGEKFMSATGMNQIKGASDTRQWQPFKIRYERTIKNICGNKIIVDAPLVQAIDRQLSLGTIYKYSFDGRISNVGVENLRLVSEYIKGQENSDEDHARSAVVVDKAEHGWVRNIQSYHFVYAAVFIERDAKNFTVSNSKNLDPVSKIDGGRRYSFKIEGSHNLFMNNETENGRHDFVTGGRVAGPNVFLRSKATKTHSDSGPHMRWATGTLYDNVSAGDLNVQDRGDMGSGHGWSGAQQVFWNSRAGNMICEKPPTAQN
jgi:hypothetical protein